MAIRRVKIAEANADFRFPVGDIIIEYVEQFDLPKHKMRDIDRPIRSRIGAQKERQARLDYSRIRVIVGDVAYTVQAEEMLKAIRTCY